MARILTLGGGSMDQSELGGEAGPHTHPISDVTDLQTTLDGKAAGSHAHAIADVTGLQTALDGKSDTDHTHPGGGSDPWTVLRLASDFPTTSATAVNVTGLAFTPLANTTYEFSGIFLTRTATATVGPRPGCAWPTGCTDGVASVQQSSSATANVFANGNIAAAVLAPVGGVPNTTASWPAFLWGTFVTGASPSGTFRVQLASETNGTTVTMKAGSSLRYRAL